MDDNDLMVSDKREDFYLLEALSDAKRHEGFDWSDLHLILNLIYSYDLLSSHFSRFTASFGLSPSAFNLLMILRRSGEHGCALHEISDLLLVSRANVTGVVDSLERKGLVKRVASCTDRRVKIAQLTQAGNALLESMLPRHFERVKAMLSGLCPEKKLQLDQLLSELRQVVQEWAERTPKAGGPIS